METYEILISEIAENDLKEIKSYISYKLLEPNIADNLVARLDKATLTLETMPERNALVRDEILAKKGYRNLLAENYLIFYSIDLKQKTVTIIRVLYARRDWMKIL